MHNFMYTLARAALRVTPLATGLVTFVKGQDEGWGKTKAAFAASGVALVVGIGETVLEERLTMHQFKGVIDENAPEGLVDAFKSVAHKFGISGLSYSQAQSLAEGQRVPGRVKRPYVGFTMDDVNAGTYGQRVIPQARNYHTSTIGMLEVSPKFQRFG